MDQPKFNDDLFELAWLTCDGTATDEQLDKLSARLAADTEALQCYVRYVAMHADLEWDFVGKGMLPTDIHSSENSGDSLSSMPSSAQSTAALFAVPSGNAVPSNETSNVHASWLGLRWPALASLLLLFAIVGAGGAEAWFLFRLSELRIASEQSVVVMPVAYLTSNTACAWGSGSPSLQHLGRGVGVGEEIALLEGIAEFRLSSGVYLSVEGPAGVVLTSPNSLVLQYGKVTANVPWSVADFRVLAGICRLEASDAEFGVSVTGGRVDLHVFSGEVISANATVIEKHNTSGDQVADSARFIVTQDRAITLLNQNGLLKQSRLSKANPTLFATKLSMAGRLPISQSYVNAVLTSKPIGFWRFESSENNLVQNEIRGAGDLQIIGETRIVGTPNNRVAEFRPDAECYLECDTEFDCFAGNNYSFEAWIKPSHFHCSGMISLYQRDPQKRALGHAFVLQLESSGRQPVRSPFSIDHPNSIRFLHRDPPSKSSKIGTSCFSQLPYSVRRWQHVVAVKRGRQMELYTDGVLSATAEEKSSLVDSLYLVVGRQAAETSEYQFIGQLDEIAVYDHALSMEEILAHVKAVDWNSEPKATDLEATL